MTDAPHRSTRPIRETRRRPARARGGRHQQSEPVFRISLDLEDRLRALRQNDPAKFERVAAAIDAAHHYRAEASQQPTLSTCSRPSIRAQQLAADLLEALAAAGLAVREDR